MKNYIALERYTHHYYPMKDDAFEDLRHLVEFLSTDYRYYDQSYFKKELSFYNSSFIYHDILDKFLYIGFSEWEINTDVPVPCDSTFPDFVDTTNSCKINVQNFHEFIKTWLEIKKLEKPFVLVMRDENDHVVCHSFASNEEQSLFIANL